MSDTGIPLATVKIDDTKCDYCLECVDGCPGEALTYDKCFEHDPDKCWICESCMSCPNDAIKIMRQTP